VRERLDSMGRAEREQMLVEVAQAVARKLEAWLAAHGGDGFNWNFRKTPGYLRHAVIPDALHDRILEIVNAIGPRAWEDVAHHEFMRRLNL